MTELTRFKRAMDSDMELRLQYLRILDGLMTDGEITPEMTSVAAKKLGYSIPAEDFRRETDDSALSPDDLETVSGGMMSRGEFAPDGRPVGSLYGYYLTWTDYWICNAEGRCPKGGVHDIDVTGAGRVCRKCKLALDERGVIECYDRNGKEI